jgi:hypothetical protein
MGATASLSANGKSLKTNSASKIKTPYLGTTASLYRKDRSLEINSSSETKMSSYKKFFLGSRQVLKRLIKRE